MSKPTCPKCGNSDTLTLTEDGYTRTWATTIDDDGTIVATYTGSEDWSDDGTGEYLQCVLDGTRVEVPDTNKIDWR